MHSVRRVYVCVYMKIYNIIKYKIYYCYYACGVYTLADRLNARAATAPVAERKETLGECATLGARETIVSFGITIFFFFLMAIILFTVFGPHSAIR